MGYQDIIIYYYLIGKQKIVNTYNNTLVCLFGFSNFMMIGNNGKINLALWFILYKFLTKIINFSKSITNGLVSTRNLIDINASRIQITKLTYCGEKTMILDKNFNENNIGIGDVIDAMENANHESKMMNCVVLNFELVNSEFVNSELANSESIDSKENKICLKELIVKYNDPEEKFHHTLKNILDFNNIYYNDNSKVNTKIVKNKKFITESKLLKDIGNMHINCFFK